jgi:cell division protein FtsL
MVDYFEATLIDPRTLKEAKSESRIENKDVPTITINGKVEKLVDDTPVRTRSSAKPRVARQTKTAPVVSKTRTTSTVSKTKQSTSKVKATKTVNSAHKDRKPKVVKAAMATDFSQPLVEEIKWDSKKLEAKKVNSKHKTRNIILTATIAFAVCMGIVIQYSFVNASFMEKKKLEGQLAEILKQNEQLEVKIEGATNMKTISEEAKEQLGMQKVDNQQKVYVDLDKSDYIKPSNDN